MEISNQGIEQVLQQIRSMQTQLPVNGIEQPTQLADIKGANFGELFADTMKETNAQMQESSELKKAYEMGDESVSLIDVMIAGQKADVGLQATLQVRNRLLSAYQDIMNMPV